MGYSEKISDAAYHARATDKKVIGYCALLAISCVASWFFWQGGTLATWAFVALVIMTATAVLSLALKRQRLAKDKTYDGVIDVAVRREPVTQANIYRMNPSARGKVVLHSLRIVDGENNGHVYEWMGGIGEDYAAYYKPGDRVRHHRGFNLPEKFDKSGDAEIICICCGRMNAMDSRRCGGCSAPLLK